MILRICSRGFARAVRGSASGLVASPQCLLCLCLVQLRVLLAALGGGLAVTNGTNRSWPVTTLRNQKALSANPLLSIALSASRTTTKHQDRSRDCSPSTNAHRASSKRQENLRENSKPSGGELGTVRFKHIKHPRHSSLWARLSRKARLAKFDEDPPGIGMTLSPTLNGSSAARAGSLQRTLARRSTI